MKFALKNIIMAFDGTSLYPWAIADPKMARPKMKPAIAFDFEIMEDDLIEIFNIRILGDVKKSGFLSFSSHSPPNQIMQDFPTKDMVTIPSTGKKTELNRSGNANITAV